MGDAAAVSVAGRGRRRLKREEGEAVLRVAATMALAVYTAPAYEGTVLEALARVEIGRMPAGHVASRFVLPPDAEVRTFDETEHPDWRRRVCSHEVGREWVASGRSLALVVPSLAARPWGRNVVLNPAHPDFARARVAEVVDVRWDPRLF